MRTDSISAKLDSYTLRKSLRHFWAWPSTDILKRCTNATSPSSVLKPGCITVCWAAFSSPQGVGCMRTLNNISLARICSCCFDSWTAVTYIHWIVPSIGLVVLYTGTLLVYLTVFNYLTDCCKFRLALEQCRAQMQTDTFYAASALAASQLNRSTPESVLMPADSELRTQYSRSLMRIIRYQHIHNAWRTRRRLAGGRSRYTAGCRAFHRFSLWRQAESSVALWQAAYGC